MWLQKLNFLHKWVGLSLSLLFLLQAVTGVLLVYRDDIIGVFDPEVFQAEIESDEASIVGILALVEQQYPSWSVRRIDYPDEEGGYYFARLRNAEGEDHIVRVIPGYGVFERPLMARIMQVMFDVHIDLMAGDFGKNTVGALGLLLVVMAVSGVVIGWPGVHRLRRMFKVTFQNPVKTLFEVHRVAGLVSCVILSLLALTGAAIVFGPLLKSFMVQETPVSRSVESAGSVLPVDTLLRRAREVMPGAHVKNVRFKNGALNRVVFHKGSPTDIAPTSQVWLEPSSGNILSIKNAHDLAVGDAVLSWMYPLHVDLALGGMGRFVNFITGLAFVLLVLTGPWLWWKRYQVRRPKKRQAGV